MATDRLQIILDVLYKGRGNLKNAQGDLQRLDTTAERAKRGWQSMLPGLTAVGVGLGGVALAAKGAWSALEGGAALLETQGKFDRLSESIGTTGDALRNDLGEGIGLLMTQAEQMGLATDLMSLGLAKTHDEAVRLSSVAGQLGMDMNQLVLTLTNQTTMRFDSLGVKVDGFKEKVAELKAAGMSADEAFKWAFIQQAEQQIELVGDRSDTTAGQLDMLKNATQNAWDIFQMEFATGVVSQFSDIEGSAYSLEMQLGNLGASLGGAIGRMGAMGDLMADMLRNAANYQLSPLGFEFAVPGTSMGDVRGQSGLYQPKRFGQLLDTDGGIRGQSGMYQTSRLGQLLGAQRTPGAETAKRSVGPTLAVHEMKDAQIQTTEAIRERMLVEDELRDKLAQSTGSYGSYTAAIDETAMAIERLSQESGDLFARLRNKEDFNLFEEVFGIGDQMGWSAYDMSQFGVAAGLFDQGRANELMKQSFMLNQAKRMISFGVGGSDLVSQLKQLEQLESEWGLAEEYFMDLDREAALGLDTTAAMAAHDALVYEIESQPIVKQLVLQTTSDSATDAAIEEELRRKREEGPDV